MVVRGKMRGNQRGRTWVNPDRTSGRSGVAGGGRGEGER